LGIYTVIVSDLTRQVTSQPAGLKLARWRELIYFGSSEGMSQFSNGPTWIDVLAETLGIQPMHYRKYAVGNADTTDLASMIRNFLNTNEPTERTLLAFWTGGTGGELSWGVSLDVVLTRQVANIQTLIDAGGRNFLIPRFWPGDVTPLFRTSFPNLTGDLLVEFDRAFDEKLQELEQAYGITVFRPDMYQFFREIWASPEVYGFVNLNNSAQNSSGDIDAFFWWDSVHFTRSAHLVISREIYRQLMVEAELAALLQTEQAWAAATADSDPENVLFFLYDDAVLYPGYGPAVHGKSEILVFLTAINTMPGFHQIFSSVEAFVTPAGDMGYTVGQFETFTNNSEGIPLVGMGRYVNVWRRDVDGNWKISLSIYSPLSPPTPGEGTLSEPPVAELPAPRWPDPSLDIDLETQRAVLLHTDQDLSEAIAVGIATGQFDAMSAFFHEDAIFYPASRPAIDGKSAIRAFFEANTMEPDSTLTTMPFESQVSHSGDLGHTLGIYEFQSLSTDGFSFTIPGVYLSVWEKDVNGNWMIVTQIHSPIGTQNEVVILPLLS
jgi:ketosteroid isomerase-like protein